MDNQAPLIRRAGALNRNEANVMTVCETVGFGTYATLRVSLFATSASHQRSFDPLTKTTWEWTLDYLCEPICRITIAIEPLTTTIGPAGDALYVPFRITGGTLGAGTRDSFDRGNRFCIDVRRWKLTHHGQFVVAHEAGDIMFSYTGPAKRRKTHTTNCLTEITRKNTVQADGADGIDASGMAPLNRQPLIAVGTFDAMRASWTSYSCRCRRSATAVKTRKSAADMGRGS